MTRSKHHTGWAGALAVAAELSRRGYDATITLGNTPSLDLLCAVPEGPAFKVQVKSLTAPNFVLIPHRMLEAEPERSLFFAVVLVPPPDRDDSFEFYLLSHHEVCALWQGMPKSKKDGGQYKKGFEGLNWGDVKLHRNRWDKLPKQSPVARTSALT